MKTVALYLMTLVISTLLVMLAVTNKRVIIPKTLSVLTHYVYLLNEDTFEINLWVNRDDHVFIMTDGIIGIQIQDTNKMMVLDVVLSRIEEGRQDIYQDEIFTEYGLIFEMPRLSIDFVIDEAELKITTPDFEDHHLMIGTFELKAINPSWQALDFNDLYGEKNHELFRSRVQKIHITTEDMLMIEDVMILHDLQISIEQTDHQINLTVPNGDLVLTRLPLILRDQSGMTYYIPTFEYLIDYQMLSHHGGDIHVHTFD